MSASNGLRRLGEHVLDEVSALVGCPAEGITGIRRTDEGWLVTVEILEVERVPETTDVLATYDVETNGDGEVAGYRRVRRYQRGQTDE